MPIQQGDFIVDVIAASDASGSGGPNEVYLIREASVTFDPKQVSWTFERDRAKALAIRKAEAVQRQAWMQTSVHSNSYQLITD